MEIKPRSVLCGLSAVKVVRHIDPFDDSIGSVCTGNSTSKAMI